MFSPNDSHDYRRALYGSYFDETMILPRSTQMPGGMRRRIQPVVIAAPKRNAGRREGGSGRTRASEASA
jgi:hypothetical protein